MNKNILKLLIFVSGIIVVYTSNACTTIIVGKKASVDGSIYIGRNADSPSAEFAVNYVYHQPQKKGFLYQSKMVNKFSYILPNHLLGYSGLPQWNFNTSFEEAGFNDAGVAISATETIMSNDDLLKIDPYVEETGVTEEAIVTILLPQIHSAREGVLRLGQIIESYGSGEGFGVAFADKNEAWYLENAGGHQWAAVKIPDDSYFVSANQSRLGHIDIKDTVNYLTSPDLIGFAIKNNLYIPAKDKEFSFYRVFGKNDAEDVVYNYPRVIYMQDRLTRNLPLSTNGDFPVFLKPTNKIDRLTISSILSNYFQNTKFDPYTNESPTATARPISVYRTTQSHILQLKPNLPQTISNIEYLNLGMTALGVYVPFYYGGAIPHSYQIATGKADSYSAYWRFRKLQELALTNFPKYSPVIHDKYAKLDRDIIAQQNLFEKEYLKKYKNNPQEAQKLLNNFNHNVASQALKVTDELVNYIITDISISVDNKYKFEGS